MHGPCALCKTTNYSVVNPHITKRGGRNGGQEFDLCTNCSIKANYSPMQSPSQYHDTRYDRDVYVGHDMESVYGSHGFKARRDYRHKTWGQFR